MASTATLSGAYCPCAARLENVTQKQGNFRGVEAPSFSVHPFVATTSRSAQIVKNPRRLSTRKGVTVRSALQREPFSGQWLKQVHSNQSERTACRQSVRAHNVEGGQEKREDSAELTVVARPVKGASKESRTSVIAFALKEKKVCWASSTNIYLSFVYLVSSWQIVVHLANLTKLFVWLLHLDAQYACNTVGAGSIGLFLLLSRAFGHEM